MLSKNCYFSTSCVEKILEYSLGAQKKFKEYSNTIRLSLT